MVRVKTIHRKIDFVKNYIVESTAYLSLLSLFSFLNFLLDSKYEKINYRENGKFIFLRQRKCLYGSLPKKIFSRWFKVKPTWNFKVKNREHGPKMANSNWLVFTETIQQCSFLGFQYFHLLCRLYPAQLIFLPMCPCGYFGFARYWDLWLYNSGSFAIRYTKSTRIF